MRARDNAAWVDADIDDDRLDMRLSGPWTLSDAEVMDRRLRTLDYAGIRRAALDLSGVTGLDTAGGWLIHRTVTDLQQAGAEVDVSGLPPRYQSLFTEIGRGERDLTIDAPGPNKVVEILARLGKGTFSACDEAARLLAFFGMLVVKTGRAIVQPHRIRPKSLASHIEQTGLDAIPIVALLSFLIGVVLAYQGADQLRRYGAEVFTVNLLGISILRELGILITAIIIAGRSGSAFTAQIGTMKVNQEIDAMETLGLDPIDVLVLPRIFALAITLPLLGFMANMIGLLGGAVMSWVVLDINFQTFVSQLQMAVTVNHLFVGLIKAPVFAFVIAMVGCYEGLKVSGSAESVGQQTTRAVVEAIFLVIVIDAMFSVAFSIMGI